MDEKYRARGREEQQSNPNVSAEEAKKIEKKEEKEAVNKAGTLVARGAADYFTGGKYETIRSIPVAGKVVRGVEKFAGKRVGKSLNRATGGQAGKIAKKADDVGALDKADEAMGVIGGNMGKGSGGPKNNTSGTGGNSGKAPNAKAPTNNAGGMSANGTAAPQLNSGSPEMSMGKRGQQNFGNQNGMQQQNLNSSNDSTSSTGSNDSSGMPSLDQLSKDSLSGMSGEKDVSKKGKKGGSGGKEGENTTFGKGTFKIPLLLKIKLIAIAAIFLIFVLVITAVVAGKDFGNLDLTNREDNPDITENSRECTQEEVESKLVYMGDASVSSLEQSLKKDSIHYISSEDGGYNYLKEEASNSLEELLKEENDYVIVISFGENDIQNADSYINYYKELIATYPNNRFYVLSLNPVGNLTEEEVNAFNEKLMVNLPSNYINSNDFISVSSSDGKHYDESTSQSINDYVTETISITGGVVCKEEETNETT